MIDQNAVCSYNGKLYWKDGDIYKEDPGGKIAKFFIVTQLQEPKYPNLKNVFDLLLVDPLLEVTDIQGYQIEGINYFPDGGGLMCAADLTPEKIKFIYDPYFPQGKYTLIGAYPGTGKTMLMSYFAAKVTRGQPFFGCTTEQAHTVLYFSQEDGARETLLPRFQSAGGDGSRMYFFDQRITFGDTGLIESYINSTGADIVIFDPMQQFVNTVNMNDAGQTRRMFDDLLGLMRRSGVTIIVIGHFNKNSKGDAITRFIGSTDIVGAARSFIALGNIPGSDGRKFFSHEKSNLARQGLTQLFRIDPDHGLIVPDGTTTKRHDELVQRRGGGNDEKLDEAQKLILENVDENGKIEAAAAYQLGEDAGISNSTMKSARSKLGMYTKKEGFKGKTIWSMPETMTGDDLKDLVSD